MSNSSCPPREDVPPLPACSSRISLSHFSAVPVSTPAMAGAVCPGGLWTGGWTHCFSIPWVTGSGPLLPRPPWCSHNSQLACSSCLPCPHHSYVLLSSLPCPCLVQGFLAWWGHWGKDQRGGRAGAAPGCHLCLPWLVPRGAMLWWEGAVRTLWELGGGGKAPGTGGIQPPSIITQRQGCRAAGPKQWGWGQPGPGLRPTPSRPPCHGRQLPTGTSVCPSTTIPDPGGRRR